FGEVVLSDNKGGPSEHITVAIQGQQMVTGVVSRKTHGAKGDFDVAMPLIGTQGIECRSGGSTGDFQLVVTFNDAVAVNGSPQAAVTTGNGTIGTGGVSNGGAVNVTGAVVTI